MTKVFPSIIPGQDFVDDSYSEAELSRMDWDTLRTIAANHPDEDVNGRMAKHDIIAALAGKQRV
jgi:hypothetical protein